jgi:4-hydroxythreonine-4-phosphate dehydrogenase
MGDPAGVGPEIIAKSYQSGDLNRQAKTVVIGNIAMMEWANDLVGSQVPIKPIETVNIGSLEEGVISVLDSTNLPRLDINIGEVGAISGHAAYKYLEIAIQLALEERIDAIVTAPLNKEALFAGGHPFSGHTEILAEKCSAKHVTMLLVSEKLRVSHVSTHVSLSEACTRVTSDRVLKVIELTNDGLKQMGIEKPSIAVAGLNPHAGEGGLFGTEEIEQISPAIEHAQRMGINVSGPFPGDTIFFHAVESRTNPDHAIDCVVTMYHDQGHIPLKLLGFYEGVNVTLGLPIIRTSVDHGTAFDIAGKGIARPDSLIAAFRLAIKMVKHGA